MARRCRCNAHFTSDEPDIVHFHAGAISRTGGKLRQARLCDLKVRIGAGAFEDDLWRLSQLRSRFGEAIKLAVDANGAWGRDDAEGKLARLAEFDLAYVEQPIPAGDFDLMLELARKSPMPLMLDESVSSLLDVKAIVEASGRLWAHLKLVKLGGIAPTLKAAVTLRNGNIPFMLGQMNEGAVATAAALHLACATGPSFAELYGADGLADDPASRSPTPEAK